jgi:hypothetical protein
MPMASSWMRVVQTVLSRPLKYQSTPPVAAANMAMLIDEK